MVLWRQWLMACVWVLALSIYILAGTSHVPFHGDESTTIWMSKDYAYITTGDWERVRFSEPPLDPPEQQLRFITGSLTKYLMGISWQVSGYTVADINEQWHWGFDWEWNRQNGHMPDDDLLMAQRLTSAVMLSAGAWVIFAIAVQISGWPAGYIASLLYALQPALLLNGRRAMFEGGLILFLLLTVLFGIYMLRYRAWWSVIGLGLMAGLALSAKHSAIFTVVTVFGIVSVWLLYTHRESRIQLMTVLAKVIVASGLVVVIFYALHPILWGASPLIRAEQILEGRSSMLDGQVAAFGGYDTFGELIQGFAEQVFQPTPQYYEVPGWDAYIGDQITAYEDTRLSGLILLGEIGLLSGLIKMLLAVIGSVALIVYGIRYEQSWRFLVVLWAAVMLITTAFITPIEWQRYYLMAILPVVLLAGVGAGSLIQWLQYLVKQPESTSMPLPQDE